ncbi:MAG: hypothetical protein IJB21_04825 [Bacilli bacterium]|nr:hypothetical protein [Bacilli bacterium]
MNNKMLKLFLIVMLLFFISSCNPGYPPTYSVVGSAYYLDEVNDSFIPEYTRLAKERGFTVKNIYGTYYIPKSIADNTVDVESKKQSTRDDKFENCIYGYEWTYSVTYNNGKDVRNNIPKELITSNVVGTIPNDYYYSSLRIYSSYVYNDYKKNTYIYFEFYNCYDVLDLDYITPLKEREYFVYFRDKDAKDSFYKYTPTYSLTKDKDKINELLQNERYELGELQFTDNYYIEYEGKKIIICMYQIDDFPLYFTNDNQEISIRKEDISALMNQGIVSDGINMMDTVITDKYFGLSDGTFNKYYIETIIDGDLENLDNEEPN